MKWLIIAGIAVVTVIAVVAIIGAMLPRDHVASVRARIAGPPDSVWQSITDAAGQAAWRSGVQRIEMLPPVDGKTTWREYSSNGPILMVMDRAERPTAATMRIADDKLPFGGTWEYIVAPDSDGMSTVTIAEHGSVYNPVFRFVSRFVFGHTATMDAYLRSLGRKYGNDVTPAVIAVASNLD